MDLTHATDTTALLGWAGAHSSLNYAPAPIILTHGRGTRVWDADGVDYLDFLAGIAVSVVGHSHPRLVAALQDQVARLLHVSNGFYNAPQVALMHQLAERTGLPRVYFGNSGAEACEAAIKLARRYQRAVACTPRFEIITFERGFHGRTYGALSATAQPKYHAGFEPMVPGFIYAPYNDLAGVEARMGAHTAAVMLELVQGEGGVVPADPDFVRGLRALCDERGVLLVFDEVQTGVGRTGAWFAFEHIGVRPDILTLAKGIAGGVPLGVMLSSERVAAGFSRGSHASTYGGNPLATRAGLEVLGIIEDEGLIARGAAMGARFRDGVRALPAARGVCDVRGLGAMTGVELDLGADETARVVGEARALGLLANVAGTTVLRFVPPLVADAADVDEALGKLEHALHRTLGG